MVKHRRGRGRAKRRRCAFVVREECGNVPAPCQTSLKGVRPHSVGVGKPGRDGAHTGERGCCCMGLSGDIWGEKRRNPKKSVVLEGYITRLPLSCDPLPCTTPILHPLPNNTPLLHHHHTHSVAVRVRVRARTALHHLRPPPCFSASA